MKVSNIPVPIAALLIGSSAGVNGQVVDSASIRTIDVAGHTVRVMSRGLERATGPIIVFEGGSSTPIEAWGQVLSQLDDQLPFLTYDPPGIGGSEWDGARPTPQQVSERLREVLRQAGAQPPFIVVGHSWAGWVSRAFEGVYREDVAGLVLIDPTQPVSGLIAALNDIGAGDQGLEEFVSLGERLSAGAPEPIRARQQVISEYYRRRSDPDVPPAPSVPTVVLVAGRYNSTELPEALRPSFDVEAFFAALRKRQNVSPFEWLSASPKSMLVYVADSAHCIHCTHADVVAWAIHRVVAHVAGPSR